MGRAVVPSPSASNRVGTVLEKMSSGEEDAKVTAQASPGGLTPAQVVCEGKRKTMEKCIVEQGEDKCGELIEAHKQCMRALGFKV
uniref:cytochrome c oxidase copper chaperone isoform X1 n=1 Tax=Myxine glutinosa TaxID=7769 RepID=UPI00358EA7BE